MESKLAELEGDWAEFCEEASDLKAKMENTVITCKDFMKSKEKLTSFVDKHFVALQAKREKGLSLTSLSQELEKIKVLFELLFIVDRGH